MARTWRSGTTTHGTSVDGTNNRLHHRLDSPRFEPAENRCCLDGLRPRGVILTGWDRYHSGNADDLDNDHQLD